LRKVIKITLEW